MKLDSSLEIFRPEIEGKVAIVTGGSTGIGSETAKTLAALGAEVHFCGRNVEAGKAIEALFPAGNAHFAKVDVTKPKELERWIKKLPVVDFMVNNVADDTRVPWEKIDVDAIERAFAVNLRSHFLAIHAALPAIRKGTGKSIVIMGTSNWMRPEANCILYNVTKSGIVGLTHALAREFGPELHARLDRHAQAAEAQHARRREADAQARAGAPRDSLPAGHDGPHPLPPLPRVEGRHRTEPPRRRRKGDDLILGDMRGDKRPETRDQVSSLMSHVSNGKLETSR